MVIPGDKAGLILSLSLIGLSFILSCFFKGEIKRKIIHIGVSNFAFIYLYVFESNLIPVLGLACFALLNLYVAIRQKSTRYGTVIFPLSAIMLICFTMLGFGTKLSVSVSLLCMGWGDGLAGLVGRLFENPKMPFSKKKTLAGFLTVFFASFIVFWIFVKYPAVLCIICALCIALSECYTPFGLDNFSVPLVAFVLCSIF